MYENHLKFTMDFQFVGEGIRTVLHNSPWTFSWGGGGISLPQTGWLPCLKFCYAAAHQSQNSLMSKLGLDKCQWVSLMHNSY